MSELNNWQEEKRSAYLYLIMAKREAHPLRKKLFQNLAKSAEDQAVLWAGKCEKAHIKVPKKYHPNTRTRLVGWLVKQLGVERLRYVLSAMKVRGMSVFINHSPHEARHTSVSAASNLRAAIFGINDGLVSNMSLILGMAGAATHHATIILAGIAGLLAGACSMAAGEFISVTSQREVYSHQIALERKELELYPEEEMEELALIYQARGIPQDQAESLARLLINNPETAMETLAREELGLNPNDLGSPIGAMFFSFFSFAFGALIPLLPFLWGGEVHCLTLSVFFTLISLFITGVLTSFFSNSSALKSGFRMLFIGIIAGTLTYFIGKLFSININ